MGSDENETLESFFSHTSTNRICYSFEQFMTQTSPPLVPSGGRSVLM